MATMATSQMPVTNMVNRSRFFSTTVDPDRLDCTPPPNSVDRPPPLARCSSTSKITNRLVITSTICRANSMRDSLHGCDFGVKTRAHRARSHRNHSGQGSAGRDRRQRRELFPVQRRTAHQGAVDVVLSDDLAHVLGADGPAVEHPHACGDLRAGDLAELLTDGATHLLGVGGAGHSAGADRP